MITTMRPGSSFVTQSQLVSVLQAVGRSYAVACLSPNVSGLQSSRGSAYAAARGISDGSAAASSEAKAFSSSAESSAGEGALLAEGLSIVVAAEYPVATPTPMAAGRSITASSPSAVAGHIPYTQGRSITTTSAGMGEGGFSSDAYLHGSTFATSRLNPDEFSQVLSPAGMSAYAASRERARPADSPVMRGSTYATSRERPVERSIAAERGSTLSTSRALSVGTSTAITRVRDWAVAAAGVVGDSLSVAAALATSASRAAASIVTTLSGSGSSFVESRDQRGESSGTPIAYGLDYVSTRSSADELTTTGAAGRSVVAGEASVVPAIVLGAQGVAARSESVGWASATATSTASEAGSSRVTSLASGDHLAVSQASGSSFVSLREYLSRPHIVTPFFDIDFELEISPLFAFSLETDAQLGFELEISPQIDFKMETGNE